MSTATLHHGGFASRTIVPGIAQAPRSVRWQLRRIWEAVMAARRSRAETEIADYITMRGGRITDALERDIERRFMSGRF